jgi:hypothetical protein
MTIWVDYDLATASHVALHAATRFDLHLHLDWQEVYVASHHYGVSYRRQPILFPLASSLDRPR